MNTLPRICSSALLLAWISAGAARAADQPSADEIAKARADCHAQEARLSELERNASWCTGDPELLKVRDAAEHSCGHAEDLLIAAGMEPKPSKPQPAPKTPKLTITEKIRTAAPTQRATAEPAAQFAAMEVDRNCEPKAKR